MSDDNTSEPERADIDAIRWVAFLILRTMSGIHVNHSEMRDALATASTAFTKASATGTLSYRAGVDIEWDERSFRDSTSFNGKHPRERDLQHAALRVIAADLVRSHHELGRAAAKEWTKRLGFLVDEIVGKPRA